MSIFSKILGQTGIDMAEKAADIADRFIQTKEEKASFEMELKKVLIDAEAEMQKM